MAEQKSPFTAGSAGQNAFKAAYDRLKEQSNLSRQNIGQDYAQTYQNLRGQSFAQGLGAAAQRGLSGGQAAGASQQIGAQQMGALGNLMQGQERALREQKLQDTSMFSNALLEGQQGQQMESERLNQIKVLLTNTDGTQKDIKDLSDIEKQQLKSLGYTFNEIDSAAVRRREVFNKTPEALRMYVTNPDNLRYERDAEGNVIAYKVINGKKVYQ